MKKYIIVAVVLAIILVGSFAEKNYIDVTFDAFSVKLEQIARKTKDETATAAEAAELVAWWEGKKKKLDLVVPHISITEADMRLAEMSGNIEIQKYPEAYAQISILRSLSVRIKKLMSS